MWVSEGKALAPRPSPLTPPVVPPIDRPGVAWALGARPGHESLMQIEFDVNCWVGAGAERGALVPPGPEPHFTAAERQLADTERDVFRGPAAPTLPEPRSQSRGQSQQPGPAPGWEVDACGARPPPPDAVSSASGTSGSCSNVRAPPPGTHPGHMPNPSGRDG